MDPSKIVAGFRRDKSDLLPMLHALQDNHPQNYLTDESLKAAARHLSINLSWVYGVAGYYSMFSLEPRGQYIIRICNSPVCSLLGSEATLRAIGDGAGSNPIEDFETVDGEYPLMLNTGRLLYHYHTATMTRRTKALRDFVDEAFMLMHPNDAAREEITEGCIVRLESRRGVIETTARISEEVLEGEVFMPWHFTESQVNRLTRDELDPYSKIAPFKLSAVKITKV